MNFISDKRDDEVLPSKGTYLNLKLQTYAGLNSYSKSFMQFLPEFSVYKKLDKKSIFVISNRIGGGVTLGNTTFYQSAFLGGQENLLGFRQYRFAGQHIVYNNLETRIKLAKVASYILPGQLGLLGFCDIGRVWEKNEKSTQWHEGVGGGVYFAPIQKIVLKLVAGHSEEGWYPYFNVGMRF